MSEAKAYRPIFRLLGSSAALRDRTRVPAYASNADFVSQLIVARHAVPEDDPRIAMEEAVTAYDKGARIAVRRMPAGFRKTIVI